MKIITIIGFAAGVMALPIMPAEQSDALQEKRQDPATELEGDVAIPLAVVGLGAYLVECEIPGAPCPDFRKRQAEDAAEVMASEAPVEKRQDDLTTAGEEIVGVGATGLAVVGLGAYLIECEVPGGYCPDFRKRQSEDTAEVMAPEAPVEKRQDLTTRQTEESPNLPIIYDLPTPTDLLTGFQRTVACFTGENCLS